jgi:hypothetical protein
MVVPQNVPIDLHSESGVAMPQLSLGDFHSGGLEKHGGEGMPERVKSNPAILMGNSELVQNRMKDFLHEPSPVKRAAQFVGEEQLMRVADQMCPELRLHDRRHGDGGF